MLMCELVHQCSLLFHHRCVVENRTTVLYNGRSKFSRFSFEAFRFVEHRNQEMSTIYLHCIMRLCEPNKCQELLDVGVFYCLNRTDWLEYCYWKYHPIIIWLILLIQSCNSTRTRRRRALEPYGSPAKDSATVSVGPLYTAALSKPVTYKHESRMRPVWDPAYCQTYWIPNESDFEMPYYSLSLIL